MKVDFLADATAHTGLGHLIRSVNLAHYLLEAANAINFLGQYDTRAKQILSESEHFTAQDYKFPGKLRNSGSDVIIVDNVHRQTINIYQKQTPDIFNQYKHVLLYDGIGKDSVSCLYPTSTFSRIILPYVYNYPDHFQSDPTYLLGPKYFVSPMIPRQLSTKLPPSTVKNVTITLGGSDPNSQTVKIMKALEFLGIILNITVILGPLFRKSDQEEIHRHSSSSKHAYNLVKRCHNILPLLCSSDLIISNSGMTKYEAFSLQKPIIIVALDNEHYRICKEIERAGAAVLVEDTFTQDAFLNACQDLISNPVMLKKLSSSAYGLCDGNGGNRILEILKRDYYG